MSLSAANAMSYEATGTKTISKQAAKKATKTYDIREMTTGAIVWHLTKVHKFALLLTFTVTYLAFNLFGTLIVGLVQSLFN